MEMTQENTTKTPTAPPSMAGEMTELLNAANALGDVPLLPVETILAGQANLYNLAFQKMMMNLVKEKTGFGSSLLDNSIRAQKQCLRTMSKIKELEDIRAYEEASKKLTPERTEGN